MNEYQLMQSLPTCDCQSMSNGFSTGVGIAAGVGVIALAAGGLYYLLLKKKR